MSFSTFGKLQNISKDYNNIIKDLQTFSSIPDSNSARQRRKALFNKDTKSLNIVLHDTPFWIWGDEVEHQHKYRVMEGKCCFNHIIGLPRNNKTGAEMPLFPYELRIFRALFENAYENPGNDWKKWKHIAIKKPPGIGATEIIIRKMLWLPMRYPKEFAHTQMCIVTGIRGEKAREIMERMKYLLYPKLGITFDTNDRELTINDCTIKAYPAKEPKSYHGLANPKFFFMDEFDFFPPSTHQNVMHALERYLGKSDPYIVLSSTAFMPDGLLEKLEKQPEEERLYKWLWIRWQDALHYIYTDQDIELAQQSDSWAREYEGEYRGLKGNLFPQYLLDYASGVSSVLNILDRQTGTIKRSLKHNPLELSLHDVISDYRYLGPAHQTSIGCDPGWNSSTFAFVVTKEIGGIIYVVKEVELQAPTHEEAVEVGKQLLYQDYPTYRPKIYIDASGVSFIRTFKKEIMETTDYHQLKQEDLVKSMTNINGMIACPIPFQKYGDRMNYHLKRLFELGMVRISQEITPYTYLSLQTASYDEDKNRFDKKATAKNDVYDAFRLSCINYKIGDIGVLTV
jgi:hypothetical protein